MPTFHLIKRNDQPTIGAKRLYHALKTLNAGEWSVSISKWEDSRSLRQNRLYWKWLTIIGNELGYYPKELHEIFLDMFAPIWTTRDLKGKPKQKPVRSSKMNVDQMSSYMERIDQFAAENNIKLPHPEEELLKTG